MNIYLSVSQDDNLTILLFYFFMQEVFICTMFTPSHNKMANQQKVNLGRLLYKRLSREMKITANPKVRNKITLIFIISRLLVIIYYCIQIF